MVRLAGISSPSGAILAFLTIPLTFPFFARTMQKINMCYCTYWFSEEQ
jgi:hypothetical protein